MPYYKVEIRSGDVYECEMYDSRRTAGVRYPRSENENTTTPVQEEINLRRARRKLSRTINCNFKRGDLFITLTYEIEPKDIESAKRDLRKFIRRLRALLKKMGLPALKYVGVTEQSESDEDGKLKRIHHHIIMPHMNRDILDDLWEHGIVISSRLKPKGDYIGLAKYITKDADGTNGHKKRWSQSRNLDKPEIERTVIRRIDKNTKVPKGYREEFRFYSAKSEEGAYLWLRAVKTSGADYAEGGRDPYTKRGGTSS